MKILKEDKLTEIVIDLNKLKENRLDESWLSMFGYHVKNILNRMFGGSSIPVSVKGSPREVDAFAMAMRRDISRQPKRTDWKILGPTKTSPNSRRRQMLSKE